MKNHDIRMKQSGEELDKMRGTEREGGKFTGTRTSL